MKITMDTEWVTRFVRWWMRSRRARLATVILGGVLPLVVFAATVTKPNTFTDGDVISAAQVNANFDAIFNAFNNAPFNVPKFPNSKVVTLEHGEMINGWIGS